jgi:YidC/Oxa1 family membrane protein insertase
LEKRLPLALFLSFLVLMAWGIFSPKPPREAVDSTMGDAVQSAEEARLAGYAKLEAPGEVHAASEEQEISIRLGTPGRPGAYELAFTNRGARLLSLRIGDYFTNREREHVNPADTSTWVELLTSVDAGGATGTGSLAIAASESAKALLTEPLEEALWNHRLLDEGGIEFSYAPGTGLVFTKRLEPMGARHQLRFTFAVENVSAEGAAGLRQFIFTPAEVVPPVGEEHFYVEPQVLAVWDEGDSEYETEAETMTPGDGKDVTGSLPSPAGSKLAYAGVHNKFFGLLVTPASPDVARSVLGASWRRVRDGGWLAANPGEDPGDAWRYVVCDMPLQLAVPEVGDSTELSFEVYAGPKQRATLVAANPAYTELLREDIGFFAGIASLITGLLSFYQSLVGNWGVAIILMTVTVRGMLFPLNRRAQTAMARFAKKMKRVQPLLDANKEKYENDPKKQREEQAKIMQQEGAFPPLGGCLPMFLQIPVFIGLFQALRVHFDLRHQPFILWMKDLSMPDQLMRLDFDTHLPFIGVIEYLNVLPLLMIVLWIMQHKVMPQPESTDPKQQQTRKIMIGMQVFFAFLFYNYASGLALYMITSSSIAIFESLVIKRMWPIDDSELEQKKKKKPGRFMQKMAELQKEQQRRLDMEQKRRATSGGKGRKKKRG